MKSSVTCLRVKSRKAYHFTRNVLVILHRGILFYGEACVCRVAEFVCVCLCVCVCVDLRSSDLREGVRSGERSVSGEEEDQSGEEDSGPNIPATSAV